MPRTLVSILFLLLLTGCSAQSNLKEILLRGPEGELVSVKVEIADDPEEHQSGLMNRTELSEGTGMLFLFDHAVVRSFWMKNTLIPLDIIFFDGQGNYVSSRTMEPCEADPCKSYSSGGAAITALEVPKGFVSENGVRGGWSLSMPSIQD